MTRFVSRYTTVNTLHKGGGDDNILISSTCAHRQEGKIVLYSLWYHHTYRWPSRAQIERLRSIQSSLNLCTGRPPIGMMIPETVLYNFALLTMSTCARNMWRLEINIHIIKFSASSWLILINKQYFVNHNSCGCYLCHFMMSNK